ncbi:hypothetical protein GOP47_0001237 [Adiantum capillus-veneris]|uniref:DNA/RNA-binding protein Kin17 WH-like domain-containing protein n=1 Tax=Adiantum capillus-veneris TaxID=13818 RepID=A0A9D4VGI3_ADICA|nr:hypothetical protein GOP47_0001237 [Adiantum capillus-veneris]
MSKNGFLTPKAIANRIKAKGLQKLRWYCQMCQKQCRDENGFKCHCMSESHQRQMQVFGDNPNRFVHGFSEEFEKTFLEHVRRSHRFSRVAATVLYNEYIADRHHVHMNSTQWATLTEFVKHLGRTGKCKVDETEKGWFVTYIDREPETLLRERLKNKRERAEVADEVRHEREIELQIDRAAKSSRPTEALDDQEKKLLQRNGEEVKVAFSFASVRSKNEDANVDDASRAAPKVSSVFSGEGNAKDGKETSKQTSTDTRERGHGFADMKDNANSGSGLREAAKAGAAALAQLMEEEEKVKEKVNRKDFWLVEGLVVKVMSKSLAEQGFYKQKGVVRKVIGKYVAEIKMLEGGAILKVDQEELETVIPQIGGLVKIVNGAYRGSTAKLLAIDTAKFTAKVQVEKGIYDGRVLNAVEYEDICKVSTSS